MNVEPRCASCGHLLSQHLPRSASCAWCSCSAKYDDQGRRVLGMCSQHRLTPAAGLRADGQEACSYCLAGGKRRAETPRRGSPGATVDPHGG